MLKHFPALFFAAGESGTIMLIRSARVLVIVLIGVIAILLGRLFWALMVPASVLSNDLAMIGTGASLSGGVADAKRGSANPFQSGAARPGAAAARQVPDTPLRLVLHGVRFYSGGGMAVISSEGGKQRLYAYGDQIEGTVAHIAEIMPYHILLERNGIREKLAITGLAPAEPGEPIASSSASLPASLHMVTLDRAEFTQILAQLRLDRAERVGDGIRVFPPNNELFAKSGLRRHDVIIAMGGKRLDQGFDFAALGRDMAAIDHIEIELRRSGELHLLRIRFG